MSDERGFTLVEVLFAMVILTVALVSLAELMAITLRMQMMGRNDTAAVRLAQSKLDELVAVDFDAAGSKASIGGDLDEDADGYHDVPADTVGFTRRWKIEAIAGETRVRLLTVRLIPDVVDRRTTSPIELVTIIRDP